MDFFGGGGGGGRVFVYVLSIFYKTVFVKFIPAYGFSKSEEENSLTKSLEIFAKSL
jgi:hypothetical protein